MTDVDWITTTSLDQLKAGYVETTDQYTCLCCGAAFEKGIIYPADGVLYEAGRYTRLHIEREHGSVFDYLLQLDRSVTGLTDVQKRLLSLFYQGKSDIDVQKALGIGSSSTVRNHRFLLREKERQAKVFLALMELLRGREKQGPVHVDSPASGPLTEREKVLRKYFPGGTEGPLKRLSMKESHRRIVLDEIAERFEGGRLYTEAEVNQVLEAVFADYVTIRRYLVDYGLLSRQPDGSRYWRTESAAEREESHVDRREVKRLAKESKTDAGVYAIRNTRNGKLLVESTRNLKTINGKQFQLEMGSYTNKGLQQEWNEFGKEAFLFEVLEVLEKPETGYFDEADELKKLKAKWLEQLQPFGDRGYHTSKEA